MNTAQITTQTTAGQSPTSELIAKKLALFEAMREDFDASFIYVQNVHGQRRLLSFPVAATVRYCHALWVCECKDLVLSIPQTITRYDGRQALEALRDWQQGDVSGIVALLEHKLHYMPFAAITGAIQQAKQTGDRTLAKRLTQGRWRLLNRAQNFQRALTAIFVLSSRSLVRQAQAACALYQHTPEQIAAQLADLQSPVFSMVRSPALAQRNMIAMNAIGITVTSDSSDQPGQRTAVVLAPTMPLPPYAEHVLAGEITLLAPYVPILTPNTP